MTKVKILAGLAALTCAVAAATTPATAYFEAKTPGATKGPIAQLPLTSTLTISGLGIVCERNAKATGFWNIQTSEEQVITKGTKQQQQPGTKVGPHEAITITDWGKCMFLTTPVSVSACRLQVAQSKAKPAIGHGSVQTDCIIGIGTVCTVTVPQEPANHDLQTVKLADNESGQGVLINANVTGITFRTAGAGCAASGLPAEGHTATFKTGEEGGESIETSLQKLV